MGGGCITVAVEESGCVCGGHFTIVVVGEGGGCVCVGLFAVVGREDGGGDAGVAEDGGHVMGVWRGSPPSPLAIALLPPACTATLSSSLGGFPSNI